MNWYKKAFDVNSKKELAYKLLEWHGGQSSPLYSVGSSWVADADVPIENIEKAIQELKDNIKGQGAYPQDVKQKNIFDLTILIGRLTHELEQQQALEQYQIEGDQASYEADISNPTVSPDPYKVKDTSPCKDPNDRLRSNGKDKNYQSYVNVEKNNYYSSNV